MSLDVAQFKAGINLIDIIAQYSELRRINDNEYHGPCVFCGGTDRMVVFKENFFCREGAGHCGRKGDVFTFIQELKNVDFKGAYAILSDGASINDAPLKPVAHATNGATEHVWDEERKRTELLKSHEQLLASTGQYAKQCLAYLESRGLTLDTIKAFKLGYRSVGLPSTEGKQKELAIAIPWFDKDGNLVSVKYRFVERHTYLDKDGNEQVDRLTSRGSSKDHVFGWQALKNSETLIIVEGEINAMSIWQASDHSVLSVGSMQKMKNLPDELIEAVKQYKDIWVWSDEKEFTEAAAEKLGAKSMVTQQDANDLLQAGKLADILRSPGEEVKADDDIDIPLGRSTWPYTIHDGMLVYQKEINTKDGPDIVDITLCSFMAKISEEIILEDGRKIFVIEGIGKRGGPFKLEIDAELYGTTNKLCAALESAVGSKDTIFAEQHKHIGPAIKTLTEDIRPIRRYTRTGWTPYGFVIPGKTIDGVDVHLNRKLAYEYDTKADPQKGKYALGRLIEAIHPGNACIVLSAMFTAPLAHLIGWDNERYGIFNKGITNSLKTSWTQAAMCIYGKGFINRDNLIKFGDGGTKTALMSYATMCGDMPGMFDNYKPNTGGGVKDFISLLHNIMEGGDRDRGSRDGGVRDNKSVKCWPIFTGEDMPDSDASSFARVLVIPFAWGKNELNKPLGEAQALSEHLPAIGRIWLDFLGNETTGQIIEETKDRYWNTREAWIKYLSDQHEDMSITLRIATSLTLNQLAFEIAYQCFEILSEYKDAHIEALRSVAGGMAIHTTESAEYQRFLAALRELLAAKRAIVIPRKGYPIPPDPSKPEDRHGTPDPDRFMGWYDDEGFYLLPVVARRLVMTVLDRDGLNSISNQQLYDQLQQAGMMVSDAKQSTRLIKIAGNSQRILHLRPHALQGSESGSSLYDELGI